MSEYQFVAFRAIDGPLSPTNLEYMRTQSSRAEITSWSFQNEYHYGDFHGNVAEMLRRGFDIHLHYANFGYRRLLIRLPHGLPNPEAARRYLSKDGVTFQADKQGSGGVLQVQPYLESGSLDEVYDLEEMVDRLAPLRAEILEGDLRPLYLMHLALARDDEHDVEKELEGPVPAGLDELTHAQQALVEFYGLGTYFIEAAAQRSSPLASRTQDEVPVEDWLRQQPAQRKDAWLAELMRKSDSSIRQQLLAEFRASHPLQAWPTVPGTRTMAELFSAADVLVEQAKQKAAEKSARARAKKLKEMAANPEQTLEEVGVLVKSRSTANYAQAAKVLKDLQEVLVATGKPDLAATYAQKLKVEHPTLRILTAELRKAGLLPK